MTSASYPTQKQRRFLPFFSPTASGILQSGTGPGARLLDPAGSGKGLRNHIPLATSALAIASLCDILENA